MQCPGAICPSGLCDSWLTSSTAMADVLATVDSIFMDTHVSMRVRKASAFVQLPRWELGPT